MCELGVFPIFLENDLLKVNKILGLTFLRQEKSWKDSILRFSIYCSRSFVRLDYQPLFGKMSPHSSPEWAAARVRFPLLVYANHVTACRFSSGKDCRRNYHIKTESPSFPASLIHRMARRFQRCGDIGEILESEGTQRLLWMIVVGEILHLQGSFQGALGLDNCVRYRCNRPCLYLTEEHSIRWKFCLVNQKLFHLICSASTNQSVRTHRRRNQYSKIKEN